MFQCLFDGVVGIAREQGVVKDRLRIQDATHVIADVAVPSALALVGQTRDKSWMIKSIPKPATGR